MEQRRRMSDTKTPEWVGDIVGIVAFSSVLFLLMLEW